MNTLTAEQKEQMQKILNKYYDKEWGYGENGMYLAMQEYADQYASKQGLRWVKDDLPQKTGTYLCQVEVEEGEQKHIVPSYVIYNEDKKEWDNPTFIGMPATVIEWLSEGEQDAGKEEGSGSWVEGDDVLDVKGYVEHGRTQPQLDKPLLPDLQKAYKELIELLEKQYFTLYGKEEQQYNALRSRIAELEKKNLLENKFGNVK